MPAHRKWKGRKELFYRVAAIANSDAAKAAPHRNIYVMGHPDLTGEFTAPKDVDTVMHYAREAGIPIDNIRDMPKVPVGIAEAQRYIGSFPVSAKPQLEQPTISGNVVIFNDIHAPYHDAALLEQACKIAQRFKITTAVLCGDTFDATAFGKHAQDQKLLKGDPRESMGTMDLLDYVLTSPGAQMYEFARVMRAIISSGIERIEWRLGNHDIRPLIRLGYEMAPQQLLAMLDTKTTNSNDIRLQDHMRVNRFRWIELENGPIPWRISHPKSYSRIPMRTACRIAQTKLCHVFCAHGHNFGVACSDSGFLGIDSGLMADPKRLEYKELWDTTFPESQQGFCYVVDGELGLYGPSISFEPGNYHDVRFHRLLARASQIARLAGN